MPHSLIVKSSSNNPWYNLALEEYLMKKLSRAAAGESDLDSILYLWQNQDTVVIGRNQNAWAECNTAKLEAEGGRLARRTTGGGAVFHDLGNLNFSLLLPEPSFSLDRNFQMIVDTVRREGINAERSGRNDILVDGLKFSGNAFRIHDGVGLHHGTLLVHSEFERVGRYLTVAPSKLAAKGVASVRSRITNLKMFRPDITVGQLSDAMEKAFLQTFCGEGNGTDHMTDLDFGRDRELGELNERFASWEWRYGESYQFDAQMEQKFDWGHVQMGINVRDGIVSGAEIYSDALDCDYISQIAGSLEGCRFQSGIMAEALVRNAPEDGGFGVPRRKMAGDMAGLLLEQGW